MPTGDPICPYCGMYLTLHTKPCCDTGNNIQYQKPFPVKEFDKYLETKKEVIKYIFPEEQTMNENKKVKLAEVKIQLDTFATYLEQVASKIELLALAHKTLIDALIIAGNELDEEITYTDCYDEPIEAQRDWRKLVLR